MFETWFAKWRRQKYLVYRGAPAGVASSASTRCNTALVVLRVKWIFLWHHVTYIEQYTGNPGKPREIAQVCDRRSRTSWFQQCSRRTPVYLDTVVFASVERFKRDEASAKNE